ncbi:MAG: hypothetical protein JXN64_12730 [Spirochaetes bacterium]|nr:hypothetical protein [Spirochaetota bacterium]
MKTTGIKKKDTITKAYRELRDLGVIGGFVPGHGSENTKFYFTFDIGHYRTEECCLELEEISSYYEMLLTGRQSGLPAEYQSSIPEDNPSGINPAPDENEYDSPGQQAETVPHSGPLQYIATVANSWGRETKLFTGKDPDILLYEDGSVFCTGSEFIKEYQQYVVPGSVNLYSSPPASGQAAASDSLSDADENPINSEAKDVEMSAFPKKGTPCPLKMVQGSPEKKDALNTINSYKITNLIVNARKDFKFKYEFNKFCTEDTSKYLKNTFFWIAKNAADFDLSLGDVIDSLAVANDKGKQGSMSYLIGIMRNKSKNKINGIGVITKPLFLQAKQYFQERFSHCFEYLKSWGFNSELNQLQYTLKDSQKDRDSMKEFFKFVVDDINKAVGVSLSAVEVV